MATASRGPEDQHGFDFTSPRYFLQVASDQAPRVELTSPESNLNAMLGRPLDLAVRAQDDHGIGTTTITYRVNRRPEKTITLPTPVRSGEGAQKLDWDYRKELPDLQIGDSVSFVVEVADKYPGEGGPHRARTESRRITFLSREEYLAAITKQMERLLTRVRALYRQERAAHEFVLGLDPAAESFLPTCQLEAIRQEMVREQLDRDVRRGARPCWTISPPTKSAMPWKAIRLRACATTCAPSPPTMSPALPIFSARKSAPRPATRNPPSPRSTKPPASSADLVMQRGIDAAREVFARETHMIARELARLRLRLLTATPDQAETLAKGHEEVAAWTEELLDKLSQGMRYDQRPLAVLGLNRRIHDLRAGETHRRHPQVRGARTGGQDQRGRQPPNTRSSVRSSRRSSRCAPVPSTP